MICLLSRMLSLSRKSITEPISVLSQRGTDNERVSQCHLLGHRLLCLTSPVLSSAAAPQFFFLLSFS